MTTWKTVPSIPNVQVTIDGRVRVDGKDRKTTWVENTRALVLTLEINGYGTMVRVVRLVGEAWSRTFKPTLSPVFRDGNRRNVRPSNIRWVSRSKVAGIPYSKTPKTLP